MMCGTGGERAEGRGTEDGEHRDRRGDLSGKGGFWCHPADRMRVPLTRLRVGVLRLPIV